ncbi:hypothetical protein ACOME3_002923 [Neoechinorhynchus agilis]
METKTTSKIVQGSDNSKECRFFETVPNLVLLQIFEHLDINDILNVSRVSCSVQLLLLQEDFWLDRYGLPPKSEMSWLSQMEDIVKDKSKDSALFDAYRNPYRLMAVNMSVVHLNGRYLRRTFMADGSDVIRLMDERGDRVKNSKCHKPFVHLKGYIPHSGEVMPGEYLIRCRICTPEEPSVSGCTRFRVITDKGGVTDDIACTSFQRRDFGNAFRKYGKEFFFINIGPFSLEKRTRIAVVVDNTDGYIWKNGIAWHYFDLYRADNGIERVPGVAVFEPRPEDISTLATSHSSRKRNEPYPRGESYDEESAPEEYSDSSPYYDE